MQKYKREDRLQIFSRNTEGNPFLVFGLSKILLLQERVIDEKSTSKGEGREAQSHDSKLSKWYRRATALFGK